MLRSRRLLAALMGALVASSLAAEAQPEIAYRILSGYVEKRESAGDKGAKVAGAVLSSIGGLAIGGAAVSWFGSDAIADAMSAPRLDQETKLGLTIGLGVGGAAFAVGGAALIAAKPFDYRAAYAEVFTERDPAVREALSVAVLRDLAIRGREERVAGALSSLLVPLVSSAIRVAVNVSEDKVWSDNLFSGVSWSSWSLVGGITGLLSTSEEERLYEKYLAGRDALYGERP